MCVAGVRTYVFNVFVSSAKRASLQRQKCSSPDQHKTRLSLAINAFVCSVMSCSEVSSRGCLVASDQHIRLQCDIEFGGETSCILKVGLETPPPPPKKESRNYGEKVSEKTSFRLGMELKKVQKQDRGEKASRTLPHYGTMPAPSLASNTMHLHP